MDCWLSDQATQQVLHDYPKVQHSEDNSTKVFFINNLDEYQITIHRLRQSLLQDSIDGHLKLCNIVIILKKWTYPRMIPIN